MPRVELNGTVSVDEGRSYIEHQLQGATRHQPQWKEVVA